MPTLGKCGCCGFTASEYQRVLARVRWPVNYVFGLTSYASMFATYSTGFRYPAGGVLGTATVGVVPERCWLGVKEEWYMPDGTVCWRSQSVYDPYDASADNTGSLDRRGELGWPGTGDPWPDNTPFSDMYGVITPTRIEKKYPNGTMIVIEIWDEWEFTDSLGIATALLDEVDLLNPTATYTSTDTGASFHFGYTSEGAIYGYNTAYTFNGTLDRVTFTAPFITNRVYLQWTGGATPTPKFYPAQKSWGFDDGYIASVLNGHVVWTGTAFDPAWLLVSKCAVRTLVGFDIRWDWLMDQNTRRFPDFFQIYALQFAVNYPRGEHLLDPSDAGGIGKSIWFEVQPSNGNAGGVGGNGGGGVGSETGAGNNPSSTDL